MAVWPRVGFIKREKQDVVIEFGDARNSKVDFLRKEVGSDTFAGVSLLPFNSNCVMSS